MLPTIAVWVIKFSKNWQKKPKSGFQSPFKSVLFIWIFQGVLCFKYQFWEQFLRLVRLDFNMIMPNLWWVDVMSITKYNIYLYLYVFCQQCTMFVPLKQALDYKPFLNTNVCLRKIRTTHKSIFTNIFGKDHCTSTYYTLF